MTLSPALAALLLKPRGAREDAPTRAINRALGWLFRPFNRAFASLSRPLRQRRRAVSRVARRGARRSTAASSRSASLGFSRVPAGFVPTQDKQYLVAIAQLPDAASLDRTDAVVRRMSEIALKQDGVQISGCSSPASRSTVREQAQLRRSCSSTLKPFDERKTAATSVGRDRRVRSTRSSRAIQDAYVGVFPPPAVNGLGAIGGFKLMLEDRAGLGDSVLYASAQALLGRAYQTPQLAGEFSSFQVNVPQLFADVDRDKVKQLGLPLNDVFQTLHIYLGSAYVNDFNKFGRTYQVIAQADAPFRSSAEDIARLQGTQHHGADGAARYPCST